MGKLVGKHAHVALTPGRQEDVVAQRHGPPAAQPEHQSPKPAAAAGPMQANTRIAHLPVETFQTPALFRRQPLRITPSFSEKFPDRRQRLDMVAEDLERGQQRYGDEGASHSPEPPPEHELR